MPDGEDHEPAQTILKAPLPNARPRARKEVLVPGNAGSPQRVDQALILTLARARSWMRALQQGGYTHTAEMPDALVWPAAAVVNQLRRLG